MSKENLISTIIENAENEAEKILSQAREECEEKKNKAYAEANATKQQLIAEANAFVPVQNSRIMTGAELEVRKIKLKAKQEALDRCFEEATKKVQAMPTTEYISLIAEMIRAEGQNGDEVIISKNDVSRITANVISKISKELNLSLTLSEETCDFAGGIILRQNGCDKNMTIEMEFSDIRDRYEAKLSKKLFNDVD